MKETKRIAVLGLGEMGQRMAGRLCDAGLEVTVYNRTPQKAQALLARGARQAQTPREAAAQATIVLSMVTDDDAAKEIWLDPQDGALAGMQQGSIAIESSTVTPAWCKQLAEACHAQEVDFLDAPVAGSRPQAEAGKLIFLVGGHADTLQTVRPVLELMGGTIHHVGPHASGATLKLAVNALFGAQVALGAELLAMLHKAGLPQSDAIEILGKIPVTSPALHNALNAMANAHFDPLFPIQLVAKDMRYATQLANLPNTHASLLRTTSQAFAQADEAGYGNHNITGIAQLHLP